MKRRSLFLTKQRDGNFMLTKLRPTIETVSGTNLQDAYIIPGEPIGLKHLCTDGVKAIFGVDIPHLTTVRVTIETGVEDPE